MANIEDIMAQPVVLQLPGMEHVAVRESIPYKHTDATDLLLDLYSPADAGDAPLPAVIFVHGEAPHELLSSLLRSGQYTGWGRLAAASGLRGVTFVHRPSHGFSAPADAVSDVNDAIAYVRQHAADLGVDADRIAIWTCSAGAPVVFPHLLRSAPLWLRCLVGHYTLLDLRHLAAELPELTPDQVNELSAAAALLGDTSHIPPVFISQAGRDRPELNASIARFVEEALTRNVSIDLMTHPTGRHSFDILDNVPRSREIIAHTLAFLRMHLLAAFDV
jgi:acetyl esterase/lipase